MEKLKLIKKAWTIDLNKIDEGFLCSYTIIHTENRGKAKSLLLKECWHYELCNGEDLTFLNIPVIRAKWADLYEFEGEEKTNYEILQIECERERIKDLQKILDDDNVKYCYISKRGSFYRPNSCGYTSYKSKAGVYDKKEAFEEALHVQETTLYPVSIKDHNDRINKEIDRLSKEIEDLKSRLLK